MERVMYSRESEEGSGSREKVYLPNWDRKRETVGGSADLP